MGDSGENGWGHWFRPGGEKPDPELVVRPAAAGSRGDDGVAGKGITCDRAWPPHMARDVMVVVFLAAGGTLGLMELDAFDWFYWHSRKREHYDYDEAVVAGGLFTVIGLLWLAFRQYRVASRQALRRGAAEARLAQANHTLEERVRQRTAQLQQELEARTHAEARLARNHRRLQRLSAELSRAEEQERTRLAADLHDQVGHTLAMANHRLGLLRTTLPEGERVVVDDVRSLVAEAIRFSRTLTFELNSPVYDHLPFPSALEWLAEDVLEGSGIELCVTMENPACSPTDESRKAILRAVREILMNVVKHAGAHQVTVAARTRNDAVILEIRDNGTGFDPRTLARSGGASRTGLGIYSVQRRLLDLDGHLRLISRPGRGTTVRITVPAERVVKDGAA